jgi:hypothetical protein
MRSVQTYHALQGSSPACEVAASLTGAPAAAQPCSVFGHDPTGTNGTDDAQAARKRSWRTLENVKRQ